MKQSKQRNYFVVAGALVVVVVVVAVFWQAFLGGGLNKEKHSFTIEDFPNAIVAVTDPQVIQDRVDLINQWYYEIDNDPNADIAYNYTRIGTLRKTLQDYRGAEQAWLNALELNKSSVNWGNLAALYYLELEEPEKAIDFYTQALLVNPNNQSYHQDLAGVYRYKLGNDSGEVEQVMLQAIASDPKQSDEYYLYLLDYYDRDGNNREKFDYYLAQLLANSPSDTTLEYLRQSGWTSK